MPLAPPSLCPQALKFSGCCKLACSEEVPEPLDMGGEHPCLLPLLLSLLLLLLLITPPPPLPPPLPLLPPARLLWPPLRSLRLTTAGPCCSLLHTTARSPPPLLTVQARASPWRLTPWTAPPLLTPTSLWAPSSASGPATS